MTSPQWAFAPLPWQLESWGQLQPLIEEQRLPHALLLAGPEGIGKLHFLQALAARLLCSQTAAGAACGECRSCGLMQAGSHADFFTLGLEEDSRVIKIDQVRRMIDFVGKTPSLGERKVVLLGPAEVMNINAANAVLKCLEEPSASTLILLYSHQPSGLTATVRSRCQMIPMATPVREASREWLAQLTGDEQLADQLLDLSAGRPLSAQALFDSGNLDQRLAIQQALDALLEGRLSALEFPALVADLDLPAVLQLLQDALEKRLKESTAPGDTRSQRCFLLRDEMARARRSIANGANPNRQLLVEDCVARMAGCVGVDGS